MTDAHEYDASHTKHSNAATALIWQLFNPLGCILDDYFAYRNGCLVFSGLAKFAALGQMLSGAPDTYDSNTLRLMIDFCIMGFRGPYGKDWRRFAYRLMFGGDDSLVACSAHPLNIFSFHWADLVYPVPLKVQVVADTPIGEFFNHFFGHGLAVYDSRRATKKIACKNYVDVLRDDAKWSEFMKSWSDMTDTWVDYWACVQIEAEFTGESIFAVERRMAVVIAFGRMSRAQAMLALPVKEYDLRFSWLVHNRG